MTDKRNGVPTLRAAVSDWLGKFAAYRLDCLSKGIWRESDEFIWDSTAPIVDALAATLAPTPPDALTRNDLHLFASMLSARR